MAVFRINHTESYTVMSNRHLRDKTLSLKAKGLLSQMLSLPDDWDYTVNGLAAINDEKETAITNALKELKSAGYVVVTKIPPNQQNGGRYEYVYDVYESPVQESKKQDLENLGLEILGIENMGLNKKTEEQSTDKQSTKVTKHRYGEYGHVLLTDDELTKLQNRFPNGKWLTKIREMDEAIERKGYKYKSHYLAILDWDRRDTQKKQGNGYNQFMNDLRGAVNGE